MPVIGPTEVRGAIRILNFKFVNYHGPQARAQATGFRYVAAGSKERSLGSLSHPKNRAQSA